MRSQSFIQDQKHVTKSDKFQPIKPELIESVLSKHGFNLASLKTGKAKLADRAGHQTTIARYRSQSEMKIGGNYLDIVAKVPHLYGAVELFLGTYRVICSNGMTVGAKFTSIKIKHLGNPIEEIEQALPILIAQEAKLVETIQSMQATSLSGEQTRQLAHDIALSRLIEIKLVDQIDSSSLLRTARSEDNTSDLYTVFNRIQEGITGRGFAYSILSKDKDGNTVVRNQTARGIGDRSSRSLEFNTKMWDIATSYLEAA